MSIRAIIADDEELARHILREYLAQQPDIEIVGECDNGFAAVKAIGDLKPDLVFLDVQMPKLDGFEVLELADSSVAVVFVTAYDQYATKAFDAAAVDYLLKPFDLGRFQTALERVRKRLASPPVAVSAAELRNAALPPGRHAERIVIRDGTRVHILPVAQIDYVQAEGDYLAFHSAGKSFLKQQTIASLEESLDSKQFVRVHRSFVVNLERIAKIEAYTKDARIAILSSGAKIPVSRAGYLRLKEVMAEP
jgi:two-component system LytT family response regulator